MLVRDDYTHQTPGAVTGAVACGVAPVPVLAVYTVIFLIHGTIRPTHPPDVTSTTHGELVVGCIAAILLLAFVTSLFWLLNGRRRWPAAILELAALAGAVDVLVDPTIGGRMVAGLIGITSLVSLVLMFAPASWWWLERPTPRSIEAMSRLVQRRAAPAREPAGV